MNEKQEVKLNQLLEKRIKRLESINYFAEYFEEFSYSILKKAVIKINEKLQAYTQEALRVFFENPFENKRTRFYVMIQLISNNHGRNNFYLDNTMNFPTIEFEGDEFTGKVLVKYSFENKIKSQKEYDMNHLRDDSYASEIILDFLEKIYSL
ncbi:hypothetical protein EV200_10917 [Pedobacter psychrotolerans]|uniref:Uncharacterized protein n=1 Tax=Pedobacter psychrotolerans TaxID=1843235 RepID=A0A4R2H510_9SPHI|nr:hypothetical protein [Pedobacter psychrotolerans]TCO19835.1 hypothetical protein EV200_10917 [Pedobacter psychrotolerans]GGE49245.1 hypothetical protein GCM10011413_14230 [Pedobacter psychrotolerans]